MADSVTKQPVHEAWKRTKCRLVYYVQNDTELGEAWLAGKDPDFNACRSRKEALEMLKTAPEGSRTYRTYMLPEYYEKLAARKGW